ncbi:MAG TPA: universal stress protein [Candidatus Dormibacteraeota bacterium]|jgi:nucleotide-binding universal stress UspA family protein|nr:universal stress protein [Candidatus Dormibacteraeota bacterium]
MQGFTPKRILVPVNGSATDEEAVSLACRLARRQKAKVYVITILEVERSVALGAVPEGEVERAEKLLGRAEAVAADLEVAVDTELLQAREAGPAIVDEVREWKADLVVVGMPYRQRFGEFHMGKTAPYVLRYAPCRALFFREALG